MFQIGAALALAWVAFLAWPYFNLYRLAQAAEARDAAGIERLTDFPALRASLSQQIITEYLARTGRGRETSELGRQVAVGAGTSIADPLLAKYVTPEAILDLLQRGALSAEGAAAPGLAGPAAALTIGSLENLWRVYAQSESHGFRRVIVYVASPARPEDRFGLTMRFRDFGWKLAGIELPAGLRARLVDEIPKDAS